MKNYALVGVLFLLWFGSMLFYLPVPVVLVLFAALVSSASVVIWLSLMKRRGPRQRSVVKPDAKA